MSTQEKRSLSMMLEARNDAKKRVFERYGEPLPPEVGINLKRDVQVALDAQQAYKRAGQDREDVRSVHDGQTRMSYTVIMSRKHAFNPITKGKDGSSMRGFDSVRILTTVTFGEKTQEIELLRIHLGEVGSNSAPTINPTGEDYSRFAALLMEHPGDDEVLQQALMGEIGNGRDKYAEALMLGRRELRQKDEFALSIIQAALDGQDTVRGTSITVFPSTSSSTLPVGASSSI